MNVTFLIFQVIGFLVFNHIYRAWTFAGIRDAFISRWLVKSAVSREDMLFLLHANHPKTGKLLTCDICAGTHIGGLVATTLWLFFPEADWRVIPVSALSWAGLWVALFAAHSPVTRVKNASPESSLRVQKWLQGARVGKPDPTYVKLMQILHTPEDKLDSKLDFVRELQRSLKEAATDRNCVSCAQGDKIKEILALFLDMLRVRGISPESL